MPRDGGNDDVRWFDVDPCYVFHPMNAYDDGDTIVLDVVRHPKMFDTELRGPAEGPPTLDRWTVDLADGKVRESRFDDRGQEFPRVDERMLGKRHRFGYAVGFNGDESTLLKHDLVSGTTATRSFGTAKQLGEFVFQAATADSAEDDGVLMGFVYDRATDRSELAILDAEAMDTAASVLLPHRVPAGFHGNWVPSGQ
jgi:carotenoid cleavage dioxygenase